MSKGREITDYIEDIITSIADIEDFTHGMSYEMFSSDKKTVYAVIRCLEILGEAAKHIPTSFRKKHPDIPWSEFPRLKPGISKNLMRGIASPLPHSAFIPVHRTGYSAGGFHKGDIYPAVSIRSSACTSPPTITFAKIPSLGMTQSPTV
jgi:uncharacterized protein with HEPN domain